MTREDAIDVLKHNYPSACFTELCDAVEIAIQSLSAQPEIIRCKDCRYYKENERWCRRLGLVGAFNKDGFCSRGERRTDER